MLDADRYRDAGNETLVAFLDSELGDGEARSYSRHSLCDRGQTTALLVDRLMVRLVEDGLCIRSDTHECVYCHARSGDDQDQCATCHATAPGWRVLAPVWTFLGRRRRDLSWLIVIHGMNTSGAWQQEFSWMLAGKQGRGVPVFIYKYGNVIMSPVLRVLQRRHAKRFLQEMRLRIAEKEAKGPPDVIAHSFGSWLLAESLRNSDIRLGRVILAGSIVDPNYDWDSLVSKGRVEEVLCHIAGRDCPARVAQFVISGSGPSGRIGFIRSERAYRTESPDFGHSAYFEEGRMQGVVAEWGEFLTSRPPGPRFLKGWNPQVSWTRSWLAAPTSYLLRVLAWPLCPLLVLFIGTRTLIAEWGASRPRTD